MPPHPPPKIAIPRFTERLLHRELTFADAMLTEQPFILYNSAEGMRPEHHTSGLSLRGLPEVVAQVSGPLRREVLCVVGMALLSGDLPVPDRPVRAVIGGHHYWIAPGQRTPPRIMTHPLHLRARGHEVSTLIVNPENDQGGPRGNTKTWRDPVPRREGVPTIHLPSFQELLAHIRRRFPNLTLNDPAGLIVHSGPGESAISTSVLMEIIALIEQALAEMNQLAERGNMSIRTVQHHCHPLRACPGSGGTVILSLRGLSAAWTTSLLSDKLPGARLSGTGTQDDLALLTRLCERLSPKRCWTDSADTLDLAMDSALKMQLEGNGRWQVFTGQTHTAPKLRLPPLLWATETELLSSEPDEGATTQPDCPGLRTETP